MTLLCRRIFCKLVALHPKEVFLTPPICTSTFAPFLPPHFRQHQQPHSFSTKAAIKYRRQLPKGSLKTMAVSQELFQQVLTPELNTLANLFSKHGYELRLAGGAVRDLIAGQVPADIDFATTATPTEMKAMFEAEEVRMINAKGEKHGTITARINDKENFEVTTLRIDVVTDGRHAEVEWTKNWEFDAARRDLTINSMFLDLKGTVYDYFGGADDLKNKKVRFVGDPVQRIQEDYLRILRYFRFYGRICDKEDLHETATLTAIQDNMSGLKQISGERIWMELRKILGGKFAGHLTLKMIELGVAPYIGLPDEVDVQSFEAVYQRLEKLDYNPITLLSALLHTEDEAVALNSRLRLSAFERDLAIFIVLYRNTVGREPSIRSFQKIAIYSKSKLSDVRLWIEEVYKYNGALELLEEFRKWDPPKFPVSGHALVEHKVPAGKSMSRVIMSLKEIWIDSDFTAGEEELLKEIPEILETVARSTPSPPNKSKSKTQAKAKQK